MQGENSQVDNRGREDGRMKVIGLTKGGSIVLEMNAAQARLFKEISDSIAQEMPDLDCGQDGIVRRRPEPEVDAVFNGPVAPPPVVPRLTASRKLAKKTIEKPAAKGAMRTCIGCGKAFAPHRKDQTCCGKVCRKKVENLKKRGRYAAGKACSAAIPPKLTQLEMIKAAAARVDDPLARVDGLARAAQREDTGA